MPHTSISRKVCKCGLVYLLQSEHILDKLHEKYNTHTNRSIVTKVSTLCSNHLMMVDINFGNRPITEFRPQIKVSVVYDLNIYAHLQYCDRAGQIMFPI